MRRATIGLTAAMCCLLARPARAQLDSREAISLQNQILELRHEIQQGAGGGASGAAPVAPPLGGGAPQDPTALTPQLLTRVSTLEEQVRAMRGQIDQLANQVQQQNAALTKQVADLAFAVQQANPGASVGSAAPAASPGVAPPGKAPAPAPPPAPARRTPELALREGNAALARHDYAGAEAAAREVLAGPSHPRQADAQYLLAQALAGQRRYQQAATTYYDVYSRAPRAARAPEALLGVAASLLALGDRGDACQALHKLRVEFPQPPARIRGATSSLHARAGCR